MTKRLVLGETGETKQLPKNLHGYRGGIRGCFVNAAVGPPVTRASSCLLAIHGEWLALDVPEVRCECKNLPMPSVFCTDQSWAWFATIILVE